ncbi:MAG: hypothetical protein OEU51_04625 [Gammaproteobacteria bacterium]|nr:hypothetical protein [Gammaproteobacteria bacterium]
MLKTIMLDNTCLILGLDGLSRAHGRNYFGDGHLGASVIAAYYLCHENGLEERTQNTIKSRIDHELRNDAPFLPVPDETPDAALLEQLVTTLSAGIGDLREVGHNIIFGAAALKAFRECPNAITPFRVEGICRLIDDFATTQNVSVEDDDGVPGIDDESALIEFIFGEFLRSVSLYAGYGQGWAGHLLTMGHAVIELSRLGYPDLAAPAHNAYRMYIKSIRRGPKETDRHIPDHPASALTPLDHDYWKQRKSVLSGLGHAFKYAYSFYNLISRLDNPDLKKRCLAESHRIF